MDQFKGSRYYPYYQNFRAYKTVPLLVRILMGSTGTCVSAFLSADHYNHQLHMLVHEACPLAACNNWQIHYISMLPHN